ncbi:Dot/Icm secretion system substrate [Legionella steigerwaltii]|uniref:Dot/Icm secretion system substrate n=1 Tax=Legionella steigerwaltii TaxID=460 RepID=A0A378L4K9_9GAMM|nr:Dot/Icm T4SS effector Wip [Legionella steigerwaltii]KTD69944.1 substrate of the Dot/Icm secretion system [Legionella steigerwaltii]STY21743.1 Dot/Icm secretion system substrate [Legionella steigerwaltii]
MANRLINKNVNIYKYPHELENNLGSITLGDLHGNPIKLIHFLFRYQIIQFNNEVKNVEEAYQQFVTLYEQYGEILQEYLENRLLLQFTQIKIDNAKERIANLDKQLLTAETLTVQTLSQLREQTRIKLKTAEEEQKILTQKLTAPKEKLSHCVSQFNHFMSKLEVRDNQTLIRLIGDEIADRGNCDYFMFRILHMLRRNHCPLNILASNHGSEFIYAFEQFMAGHSFAPPGYIGDVQIPSFWGLKLLLEHDIIRHEELTQLVNESYKPALKILDYTLSEQGITLFSHAPIRFDAIQLMAARLGVNYDDSTASALAATIDQINHQFQFYVENNTIHSLFHSDAIHDRTNMSEQERATWPLVYLFWNRWDATKETETARPATHNGYKINYVHGHDGFQSLLPHIYNLDTACGKDPRKTEDEKIDKAFRFIKENHNKTVDKTPSESYLRDVLKLKVFDSDEHSLEFKKQNKLESLKTSHGIELNDSIKKLGLLGKPMVPSSTSFIELNTPTTKTSLRELIITSEEEDKIVFFLN